MAKLTLSDLANLQNEQSAVSTINTNNSSIEIALENTLSRDGTSPNEMAANLDMDSNRILNLPAPVANTEPARKIDLDTLEASVELDALQDAVASAEAAQAAAETAQSDAETSAASASTSASSATTSASAASTSATSASSSASSASTSASTATTQATNAATSASAASTSATNAASSASTASTQATNAASSASAASTSASNASTSASAASTSATNAASSASSASSSASAASTSETNAASSASSASTSASSASTSATTAANNATVIAGEKFNYETSTTMAQPSVGGWRANNATVHSATALAISSQSSVSGNPDVSDYIATWDDSTNTIKGTLIARELGNPGNAVQYEVTSVTDNSTWLQIGVQNGALLGSASWSASDPTSFQFYRAGNKGADGAGVGDVVGPASSVDGEIVLFDSTTGKLIKRASTTGILKASSGVLSAAVASTDYAPATSGSSILKGNGSGGFSSASAGDGDAIVSDASDSTKGKVELATDAETQTGTDTGRAITPANLTAAAIKQGKHSIWIPASAMTSRSTNGAALNTIEMSTNKNMVVTLDFDSSTQEFAQFEIPMPKSWDEGTITFEPHWSHASTTTNFGVVWALQAVARSNDDPLDVAFGTEQTSTDTGGTTNDFYAGPESSAITVGGSPAEKDSVLFQIKRNVSDGSDTMAIDARLHGIFVFITLNAATDA